MNRPYDYALKNLSLEARLRCPVFSLPTERLRRSPTAALTAPSLYLPPAALGLVAGERFFRKTRKRGHHSTMCTWLPLLLHLCGKRSEDGRFGTVDPSPTVVFQNCSLNWNLPICGHYYSLFNIQYSLFIPSIERPFAVPGALLADGAAASLTDRCTHCALAVSATGSARARGRGEIFSQKKEQREP